MESKPLREQGASSEQAPLKPTSGSPRVDIDGELVGKILEKTQEGKIYWSRTRAGHKGRSSDASLTIELVVSDNAIFGRTWRSFVVSKNGEEILVLENESNGLMALAGVAPGPSSRKVSALLNYLETARIREVKSALADLDKL